jgi:hypothetical protein
VGRDFDASLVVVGDPLADRHRERLTVPADAADCSDAGGNFAS